MSSTAALYLESISSAKEKNSIIDIRLKENLITLEKVRNYYEKVSDFIFPYLKNRPQVLKRNFRENPLVFNMKMQNIQTKKVPVLSSHSELPGIDYEPEIRDEECIICYNKETIEYINNMGCLEINTWHSSVENLENPDYLIISIEPSKRNTFSQAVRIAKAIKLLLDKCSADPYCKTAGDSGIHIYIPMGKKYPYRQVRELAYFLCMHVNLKMPELTSLKKDVATESQRVYLNYQLNRRGFTAVAPYSMRSFSWAPVSTPLLWSELTDGLNPFDFNITTIPSRLQKLGDIYAGILDRTTDLEHCMRTLQNE